MTAEENKNGLAGTVGSISSSLLVGLCPVCIPAIGGFLGSIGFGFLVNEAVLKPIVVVFLLISVGGLVWSHFKEHGKFGPLVLGTVMALSMYIGKYFYFNTTINLVLMYGSIPGIIGASIWNIRLKKSHSCNSCSVDQELTAS